MLALYHINVGKFSRLWSFNSYVILLQHKYVRRYNVPEWRELPRRVGQWSRVVSAGRRHTRQGQGSAGPRTHRRSECNTSHYFITFFMFSLFVVSFHGCNTFKRTWTCYTDTHLTNQFLFVLTVSATHSRTLLAARSPSQFLFPRQYWKLHNLLSRSRSPRESAFWEWRSR